RFRSPGVLVHENDEDLRIGACSAASGDGADYAFDGLIDDARMYARALSADELADPADLPEPGWKTLAKWDASSFAGEPKTWTINLSPGITAPGEFELDFRKTGGEGSLEIRSVVFLVAGKVLEGRAKPIEGSPGRFSIYRMEQTTADSPSAAGVTASFPGGKACRGEVRIRPRTTR
ncbi:MAG: hypothetical protein NTW87_08995, partial [Planctomycetota bacterium]|nr:hypothetical protein [Planctomycetota bacterium]